MKYAIVRYDGSRRVGIVSRHRYLHTAEKAKNRYERALEKQFQSWHTQPLVAFEIEEIND